jgi:hypothetical protein
MMQPDRRRSTTGAPLTGVENAWDTGSSSSAEEDDLLTPSEEGGEEEPLDANERRQRRRKAPPPGFCCRQARRLSVVPGCTPLGLCLRRLCCRCNMKFLVCCNIWSAFGTLILFFFGAAAFPTDE